MGRFLTTNSNKEKKNTMFNNKKYKAKKTFAYGMREKYRDSVARIFVESERTGIVHA